jgi:arginine deiminase
MLRRSFLASLSALPACRVTAQPSPFVSSDIGPLKRVLVHPPGPETRTGLGLGSQPRFLANLVDDLAAEDHLAMTALLRRAGAEILTVESTLDEAVDAARKASAFEPWLRGWAPQLAPRATTLKAADLLGATASVLYHSDEQGHFTPLADPAGSFYWTRDSAMMTPHGVIIGRFLAEARLSEATLIRFAYQWSPGLRRYPVVYDAAEFRQPLEGGDLIVASPTELWLGVGNRTHEDHAPRLARRLNMDVAAIQMPSGGGQKQWSNAGRNAVHTLFLHLDTICTLVAPNTVLAVPNVLEAAEEGKDPLTRMLAGIARHPSADEAEITRLAAPLRDLGRVRVYKAGSGELEKPAGDAKLVDWLRARGYRVVFVGGPKPRDMSSEQHFTERVIRELRRQAANVVATAPGRVLAYTGNTHTVGALRDAGIEVDTFTGNAIMRNGGGPHCLTQPLERGG